MLCLYNKDFAVAFLGYDGKIESNTRGKYVFFLTDSEYEQLSHSSLDYDQKYYVHGELEALADKVKAYTVIILCILFFIACFYHAIITRSIMREVIKYSRDGFLLNVIKGYYKADHALYSAVPLLLICFLAYILKLPYYCVIGYVCICYAR
ncbi:hypothetical protein SAMN02910447_03496 [Ruminococcus sp. YE71]|nr:hypothetical protein SAMN02910446_03549 [Ruminococcus sp. YE78]SFW52972.1 hypothetical protein SAMN02910447_03496 [Ruminococcus sp. YE71]